MADKHEISFQNKFTSVPLDSVQLEGKGSKIKVPRRVLHFSDGVVEEYSTDEEDCADGQCTTMVDPKSLTWLPWCTYYATSAAKMSLSMAELCGEKLAWVFGITAPKYGYAIEEYKRIQKEVAEDHEREKKLSEQAQVNSAFDVKVIEDEKSINNANATPDSKEEPTNKY